MDDLLSVTDAAKILGVAPTTVRLMEQTGKLPAFRTAGGIRLFRRSDVEQLAQERAKKAEQILTVQPIDTDGGMSHG